MLGPEIWSRVISITNTAAQSEYPHEFHALVFEFSGILWFYADVNGTQSLSLRTHHLEEDKADLGPLLRVIEPGFTGHKVMATLAADAEPGERPPNNCFVASVAALQAQLARGEPIMEARLLSFYRQGGRRRVGHTLLTYTTPRGAFAVDPADSGSPREISRSLARNALALARLFGGDAVDKARWVVAPLPAGTLLAASETTVPTRLGESGTAFR
jgi:hypothetical protein